MHVIAAIKHYLGWCPHSPMLEGQNPIGERVTRWAETPDPDVPQPDSSPGTTAGSPDWFTAAAIGILFATCFFGGLVWWPFVVLAVLVAGLAYLYLRRTEGVC
jgi:hypothetical protein